MEKKSSLEKLQHIFFAIGIGLAPITFSLYFILSPFVRGDGKLAIASNITANPLTNQLHLVFGVMTAFFLPIGFLGMAILLLKRSPWFATLGGMLGLIGWIPWSALIAQEAMTYDMAQLGGGNQYVALWDLFNRDGVMTFFLIFYIFCHLISAVLLGTGFVRTRIVPVWSGWALILTSPLSILAFPLHSYVLFYVVCALFILGMVPASLQMLKKNLV